MNFKEAQGLVTGQRAGGGGGLGMACLPGTKCGQSLCWVRPRGPLSPAPGKCLQLLHTASGSGLGGSGGLLSWLGVGGSERHQHGLFVAPEGGHKKVGSHRHIQIPSFGKADLTIQGSSRAGSTGRTLSSDQRHLLQGLGTAQLGT